MFQQSQDFGERGVPPEVAEVLDSGMSSQDQADALLELDPQYVASFVNQTFLAGEVSFAKATEEKFCALEAEIPAHYAACLLTLLKASVDSERFSVFVDDAGLPCLSPRSLSGGLEATEVASQFVLPRAAFHAPEVLPDSLIISSVEINRRSIEGKGWAFKRQNTQRDVYFRAVALEITRYLEESMRDVRAFDQDRPLFEGICFREVQVDDGLHELAMPAGKHQIRAWGYSASTTESLNEERKSAKKRLRRFSRLPSISKANRTISKKWKLSGLADLDKEDRELKLARYEKRAKFTERERPFVRSRLKALAFLGKYLDDVSGTWEIGGKEGAEISKELVTRKGALTLMCTLPQSVCCFYNLLREERREPYLWSWSEFPTYSVACGRYYPRLSGKIFAQPLQETLVGVQQILDRVDPDSAGARALRKLRISILGEFGELREIAKRHGPKSPLEPAQVKFDVEQVGIWSSYTLALQDVPSGAGVTPEDGGRWSELVAQAENDCSNPTVPCASFFLESLKFGENNRADVGIFDAPNTLFSHLKYSIREAVRLIPVSGAIQVVRPSPWYSYGEPVRFGVVGGLMDLYSQEELEEMGEEYLLPADALHVRVRNANTCEELAEKISRAGEMLIDNLHAYIFTEQPGALRHSSYFGFRDFTSLSNGFDAFWESFSDFDRVEFLEALNDLSIHEVCELLSWIGELTNDEGWGSGSTFIFRLLLADEPARQKINVMLGWALPKGSNNVPVRSLLYACFQHARGDIWEFCHLGPTKFNELLVAFKDEIERKGDLDRFAFAVHSSLATGGTYGSLTSVTDYKRLKYSVFSHLLSCPGQLGGIFANPEHPLHQLALEFLRKSVGYNSAQYRSPSPESIIEIADRSASRNKDGTFDKHQLSLRVEVRRLDAKLSVHKRTVAAGELQDNFFKVREAIRIARLRAEDGSSFPGNISNPDPFLSHCMPDIQRMLCSAQNSFGADLKQPGAEQQELLRTQDGICDFSRRVLRCDSPTAILDLILSSDFGSLLDENGKRKLDKLVCYLGILLVETDIEAESGATLSGPQQESRYLYEHARGGLELLEYTRSYLEEICMPILKQKLASGAINARTFEALERIFDASAHTNALERLYRESREQSSTKTRTFYVTETRGIILELSSYIADACYHGAIAEKEESLAVQEPRLLFYAYSNQDPQTLVKPENAKLSSNQLPIFQGGNLAKPVILRGGEKALLVFGINPTGKLAWESDPESVFENLMDQLIKSARTMGATKIVIPWDSIPGQAQTNRPLINWYIRNHYDPEKVEWVTLKDPKKDGRFYHEEFADKLFVVRAVKLEAE